MSKRVDFSERTMDWLWRFFIIFAMAGCATQKENHQHTTHTIEVDSLSHQAEHDGHNQQTSVNLDSIVTASVWAAMQEFAAQEHSKETTTETITTWVDSLGREIRQEQRTTQRELSKQEQQRWQQTEQRWQNELHATLLQMDSVWSDRLQWMERSMRDSLESVKSKQSHTSAAPAVSWWQKTWAWLRGILIGIAVGAAMMMTRKYWSKWIRI